MKTTELNILKNTLENTIAEENKTPVSQGTLLDLLDDVVKEKIVPLTDDHDNIIGINGHTVPTGVKCSKRVGGHMTMGRDEDERKRDEESLMTLIEKYGQLFMNAGGPNRAFEACLKAKAAGLKPSKAFITGAGNNIVWVLPSLQRVIDEDGNTLVSCNVPSNTAADVITQLLEARLVAYVGSVEEL